MVNENEICFIMCTNDRMYAEECIHYIRHLEVPEGMQINALTVEDALSMTSGYNEAMENSNARYKIYLHQDTFIVNPHFIADVLNVFNMDDRIGMLGMVGAFRMPSSGIMWQQERVAAIYSSHIFETHTFVHQPEKGVVRNAYYEVEAIDGLLMATRYDIPWREDLFTGWDFYDASQSMEFIRAGYKVVVPRMREPWVLHDSGYVDLSRYEESRLKYVAEYLNR